MKKHYPELEQLCELWIVFLHPKCQNLANSIRTCNTINASHQEKKLLLY